MQPEGIICPECNTSNEVSWSFCQQCGNRLPKSPPPPSFDRIPVGLKTVPEPLSRIDTSLEDNLRTVADKAGLEEENAAAEHSVKTEPEPFRAPESPGAHETPAASDAPATRAEPSTVIIETPHQPKYVAPPLPPPPKVERIPEPPPPPPIEPAPKAERVPSVSGVLCTQCGQSNSVGSASCASCGAPMSFGKTQVMSSQPAPTRGRLHLVMEGGQPGEVYQLSEDTIIGRSAGDIVFPHDGFMSGRHARILQREGSFVLTDEGSRNGTFVKIKGEVELKPGDMILVGKQLFRFEV